MEAVFGELCHTLEEADLCLKGLFLNADKAFAVTSLRQACERRDIEANIPRNRRSADWQTDDDTPLDPELYRRRQVIAQLNTWLDGFKTLLVRFETSLHTWLAFHWLAFAVCCCYAELAAHRLPKQLLSEAGWLVARCNI